MTGQTIVEVCQEIIAGTHQDFDLTAAERDVVEWGLLGYANEQERAKLRNFAEEVRLDDQRQAIVMTLGR